jgi:predicted nucleic acid-binding protein
MRFVDTNILVDAVSTEATESKKTEYVTELLTSSDLAVSWQVLQEFYATVTRPSKRRAYSISHDQALEFIKVWRTLRVIVPTWNMIENSFALADRYQLPYWDAMILVSAIAGRCHVLLSEDFQEGQRFGRVKAVNPFR